MALLIGRREVVSALALAALTRRASAEAADFYAGKTINVICGYNPGGGVDLGTRLIADNIGAYIPGNPKLVVQNLEGAAGLVAANHIYSKATNDGLTLAVPGRDWILKPLLDVANARFDPTRILYLGSTGATNTVAFVNAATGLRTAADLKSAPRKILFGGLPGATLNAIVPALLARLGWPIEVVRGYANTSAIIHAMEQKELDAIYTPESSFARRRDLIESQSVLELFQSSPGTASLPLIGDLVDAKDRALLELAHGQIPLGMPLVAPPGTPPDRVAVLRAAFMAMARDPAFEPKARRIDEPFGSPISGTELQSMVARMVNAITPSIVDAYSKI